MTQLLNDPVETGEITETVVVAEVASGRDLLSAAAMRELREGVVTALTLARSQGGTVSRQASWVSSWVGSWIAPRLAERDAAIEVLQLQVDHTATMLIDTLAGAERFRELTEQSCPAGLHGGWYAPAPRRYACPWCLVDQLTDGRVSDPIELDTTPAEACAGCNADGEHVHAGMRCTVGERS